MNSNQAKYLLHCAGSFVKAAETRSFPYGFSGPTRKQPRKGEWPSNVPPVKMPAGKFDPNAIPPVKMPSGTYNPRGPMPRPMPLPNPSKPMSPEAYQKGFDRSLETMGRGLPGVSPKPGVFDALPNKLSGGTLQKDYRNPFKA